MDFHEMCDKVDEILHDHGKVLTPVFIFIAALVLLGIGYIATHPFPQTGNANIGQEMSKQ